MRKKHGNFFKTVAVASFVLSAGGASASVTLPGGDSFLDGSFYDLNYGETGIAYVQPYLYLEDLATTNTPGIQAGLTNLTYGYNFSGLGSNLFHVSYSIRNDDPLPFKNLRFMMKVQADGQQKSYLDTPSAKWGAKTGGDPDQYQIALFSIPGLGGSITTNNGLDGSDSCGDSPCDVDFALQWNLASLASGMTWKIDVGLSDKDTALSTRYLQAIAESPGDAALTFSGNAAVVPIPGAVFMLSGGLAGLGWLRRRRGEGICR